MLDILRIPSAKTRELPENQLADADKAENVMRIELFMLDTTDHISRDIVRVLTPYIRDKNQLLNRRVLRNCRMLLTHLQFYNRIQEFIIKYYCNMDVNDNLFSGKITKDFNEFLRLIVYQHDVFRKLELGSLIGIYESYWEIQPIPFPPPLIEEGIDEVSYQICENMQSALLKHLVFVNSSVKYLSQKYKDSGSHYEIDLFYRFILDLLGQSQDGKLFQKKLENESEGESSSSVYSKILAGATILALNIFFCTYVILKAYVKESTWQTLYLNLCIFQIVTEVFVFSSVECVLLHFTLPSLAFDAVQKVLSTITHLIDDLLETEVVPDPFNILCIFNAPQHLFVSSRLAVQFPNSLESVLISSYNTCVPTSLLETIRLTNGLDSNKLSGDKNKRNMWTTFISSCKRLGTFPFLIQRLVVRLVQPIVLTGVTTLFAFVKMDAIYSAVIFILLIALTLLIWYLTVRFRKTTDRMMTASSVVPIYNFGYIFDDKDYSGSDFNFEDDMLSSEESYSVDVSSYSSTQSIYKQNYRNGKNQYEDVSIDSSYSSVSSSCEGEEESSNESASVNISSYSSSQMRDRQFNSSEKSRSEDISIDFSEPLFSSSDSNETNPFYEIEINQVRYENSNISGSSDITGSDVSDTDQNTEPPPSKVAPTTFHWEEWSSEYSDV